MRLGTLATVIGLATMLLMSGTSPSLARGDHSAGHSAGGQRGMRDGGSSASFAGGRRHGNDAYTKAASEERDRLLDTKIKSICRGC
jgi:hypothetical protein